MEAARFDEGKSRYFLLPQDGVDALTRHYGVGAGKYGDFNWEKGMAHSRVYDSLQRHAAAWRRGEDFDPENGSLHMIAVAWNALTLAVYQMRGLGTDDRNPPLARTDRDTVLTVIDADDNELRKGVLVGSDAAGCWLRHPRFDGTGETVVYYLWPQLKGAAHAAGS